MGKSKAPAPDPRMGEAAARQIGLAERQYADFMAPGGDRDFMRGIANESIGIQRDLVGRANAMSDYQLGQMRFNDGQANLLSRQLMADVQRINPNQLAGQAAAGARRELGIAKDIRRRDLERRGVNPFSGRALGDSRAMAIDEASAVNSASMKTRMAAEQLGLANKMQLFGGLRGLGGLGAGVAGQMMGITSGAAGSMTGSAGTSVSANNAGFNSAMGGMSAGIGGLGQFSQLRQNAAQINNAANPFPALLGAGATLGAAWLGSDRRLKQKIRLVGVHSSTGLNLYEFEYANPRVPGRWRGVMADEVEQLYPRAVADMGNGYQAVNYQMLGIPLQRVDGGEYGVR